MDLANDKFDPQRFGLITGSACDVMFPIKSDRGGQRTYAKKLATQKYFKYYDEVSTWQTEHGSFSENEAFEYMQHHFDKNLKKGFFMCLDQWGGTCDAISDYYGVDFKCPTTLQGFLDYIHDGIDKQQENQAQMYMFLFKKDLWKVAVYLTETFRMSEMGLTYPVEQSKRMILIDVHKRPEWEARLRLETPNIIKMRDEFYSVLVDQFGNKEDAGIEQKFIDQAKEMLEPKPDYSSKIEQEKN